MLSQTIPRSDDSADLYGVVAVSGCGTDNRRYGIVFQVLRISVAALRVMQNVSDVIVGGLIETTLI